MNRLCITIAGTFNSNCAVHVNETVARPRSSASHHEVGHERRDIDVEANEWINSILNDTEPMVKPEQALVVSEILEAIYASDKSGEPVKFYLYDSIDASSIGLGAHESLVSY